MAGAERVTRSGYFLSGLAAVLVGIGLERPLELSPVVCLILIGFGILGSIVRFRPLILVLLVFGFGSGSLRAALQAELPIPTEREQEIVATIVRPPDARRDQVKYIVALPSLPGGRLLVRAPLEPRFEINDHIQFACTPKQPEPFEGFAYDRYLALDQVTATCSARNLELVERGRLTLGRAFALGRNWVTTRLNRLFPEPEASFAAGLMIGSRRGLPEQLTDAFNRTGTTHVIALSGFNISIITALFMAVAVRSLGRRRAFWAVSAGVGLFVMFVGAQASIVRAGIMGVIAGFAGYVGRPSRGLNALALSGTIMVVLDPLILLDDVSFQLSFASTLGLILIGPSTKQLAGFLPERFGLRESVAATLAATLATLPIILASFGRVSLVALPVNVLVLAWIPLAMGLIACALAVSCISLGAGLFAAVPAWLVLRWVVAVVMFFGTPAWSSISFGDGFGAIGYGLYGPLVAGYVVLLRWKRKAKP